MKQSYSDMKNKLDSVVAALQEPNVGVDEAVKLHEEAKKLIVELEAYLQAKEAKITKATKK
jgi:exodeoxyribonuclease VII small subunit